MSSTKVYLVGAGPGDAGLMTLRGHEVLGRADVVIYDRLVSDSILAMIPDSVLMIDAGKSSGSLTLTHMTDADKSCEGSESNNTLKQRNIESLMIELARTGRVVVRLKGGDPFMFGRGGEEAEALIKAGIDFEVVPGVTSAISVPSYAGIPVTHRDYCSGVNIFTAHDKNNLVPDFNNTTSIFLMGVSNAKELQDKLLSSLSPDTSCAVIENGTTSKQRIIRTRLDSLHNAIITNEIKPPAVILAGHVANLNLNWREHLKLRHKRIIITRPEGRAEELSRMLRDEGAEVITMPTIKTSIIHHALDNINLSGYDWLGFTSVTGVNAFFELLCESGRDIREIGNAKIAAIGDATRDSLNAHGLHVDYVPDVFDALNLAEGLSHLGGRMLMFRALNGTESINETFRKYGISYEEICIYRTDYVELKHVPEFADIIIFTSASTVRGFAHNISGMRDVGLVCIGKQTADEARREGFKRIKIAERASVKSLFEAVMSCS